ncbi:DUF1600 domain-containing protein [Mycoplasmoides alvi]|uniref:DUF1600 domain-containing protein n=1 Tax=Mycoplasmoides alvi TaxID=78580 RepID=UPI00051C87AF|nr:DUF1600 domain-containing protein [Mycoplasmoides alvi]
MKNKNVWNKYFNFYNYNWISWMHLLTLIISIISPILCLIVAIITSVQNNNVALVWFSNFDTWTYQTNCLITFYVWFNFWNKENKIFKNHNFLISITTYIIITFTFFNFYFIVNQFGGMPEKNDVINGNPHNILSINNLFITSSTWNHFINPVFFLIFSFSTMVKENKLFEKNFYKWIILTMIYPTIYCIYLILIPWSGFMDTGINSYSVYGSFTQTKYNNLTWLWIPPLYILFTAISTSIWQIKKYLFNKNKPQNLNLN